MTMKVTVHYLGPIRVILKKRDEEIEIDLKTTVLKLLRKLANAYGKVFQQEVFDDGGDQLRESLIVTINGKAIGQLNGMNTGLQSGDVVTLLPLFAGGGSR
jgi:MoaD family protein